MAIKMKLGQDLLLQYGLLLQDITPLSFIFDSMSSWGWTMGPLKAAVQDTQSHPTPRIKNVLL